MILQEKHLYRERKTGRPSFLTAIYRMLGLEKHAPVVQLAKPGTGMELEPVEPGITIRNLEPEKLPYCMREDFLSPAETSFYLVLKSVVGAGLVICPQAALSAIFFVPRSEYSQAYQNKIDRKRVDFLLCNPKTLKPVFAIELDDSSYTRPDRQEQDAFVEEVFATAHLPLVRIAARQAYNTSELIALFQAAMQKNETQKPAATQSVSA
jgi:Protein of unknown function (DUF2726)